MNITFNDKEILYYDRHFKLAEIGKEGQQYLKNARVLCVGAGGLGSPILLYLAAAGIGTIGLMDDDKVEISNLSRQILYSFSSIGEQKAAAAKTQLQKVNPFVQINAYDVKLSEKNALEIISPYDIVVDGSDNFTTKYLINEICVHLKKPNVYASVSQFEGQCSVFTTNNGPCLRCLFDCPPSLNLVPNCAESGVLGIVPGTMGLIQATEVIKLICHIGTGLVNRLLLFNALEMSFREITVPKNLDCKLCSQPSTILFDRESTIGASVISAVQLRSLMQTSSEYILVDVRNADEYALCNLGGKLIPLNELEKRHTELEKNKHIIVYCKMGARGQLAGDFLKSLGYAKVSNLAGGIMAWIDQIDPMLNRY